MLTAHKIKILQSLDKKKFRQKYNLFLVEGNKTIKEIPNSHFKIKEIFSLNPDEISTENVAASQITPNELKKISFLQHPKDSVAVCELINEKFLEDLSIPVSYTHLDVYKRQSQTDIILNRSSQGNRSC